MDRSSGRSSGASGVRQVAHAGTEMPLTCTNAVGPAGLEPATLGLKSAAPDVGWCRGAAARGAFLQVAGTMPVRDVPLGAGAAGSCRRVR